jgi:inosine-uridine nucleoside N-ribohydrolase
MNEADVVTALARKASLREETAAAVLHAIRELVRDGELDGAALLRMPEPAEVPPDDPSAVERLIARAKKHPLGLEFLASGLLATVAITLGAHAFTVEAARRRLKKEQDAREAPTP